MSQWAKDELQRQLERGPYEGEDFFRLKVTGNGETKTVNISASELAAIVQVLDGDDEPCTCEIGGYRQSPGNAGWTAHAADCPVRTTREGATRAAARAENERDSS